MQWTNVIDGLPMNGREDVIVTVEDNGIRYVIPSAQWNKGKWYRMTVDEHYEYGDHPWDEVFVDTQYEEIMQTVVAWMLQPEPYEG